MCIEWEKRKNGQYVVWYEPEAKAEKRVLLYQAATEKMLKTILEEFNERKRLAQ